MTSALLTPWSRRRQAAAARADAPGSTAGTAILDVGHLSVVNLAQSVSGAPTDLLRLREAHRAITGQVRAVYAVKDHQPASRTLRRGRGSCSQRLAVLEAVARSLGIPTRVRGLVIDGRFWYPRFPQLRHVVPDRVILAWPEFLVDGAWLPVAELFGSLEALALCGSPFTNSEGETLFDAIGRTAVDWTGATGIDAATSACDLSGSVLQDLGLFTDRDQLFRQFGQTMCGPFRTLLDPFLSRWGARR